MIIATETFEMTTTETHSFGMIEKGSVEVTLNGQTRRVRGSRWILNNGKIEFFAYDMTGRYQTGAKAWPASVCQRKTDDGKVYETANFGRDDRSGHFNKLNCLFFAD